MASEQSFGPAAFGPMANPFDFYIGNLDTMAQNFGPLKGLARGQLELMGLMSRRAQAHLEIPSRLGRCRTPQDVMNEQMRFWQTAFQQYAESSRRIGEAWMQASQAVMTPMSFNGNGGKRRERDYIAFPEPKDDNGAGRGRERRVA